MANLQRSIECFTKALRFFTAESAPADYAATQVNLGAAYAELPTGDRGANLARAIDLWVPTTMSQPLTWSLSVGRGRSS